MGAGTNQSLVEHLSKSDFWHVHELVVATSHFTTRIVCIRPASIVHSNIEQNCKIVMLNYPL